MPRSTPAESTSYHRLTDPRPAAPLRRAFPCWRARPQSPVAPHPSTTRPPLGGFSVMEGPDDLLRPLARGAGGRLALAKLLDRDRLPRHRQAAPATTPPSTSLQALRDRLGKPLIVLSAYRSPEHNRGSRRRQGPRSTSRGSPSTSPWPTTIPKPSRRRRRATRLPGVRLLSAFGVHACRPRAGAELGRAVSEAGVGLRGGDAAGSRGADRQPHPERWRSGRRRRPRALPASRWRSRSWRRPRARCCRWCPDLGTLRWLFIAAGVRRHRGHDLRTAGRLEKRAAMIAGLVTRLGAPRPAPPCGAAPWSGPFSCSSVGPPLRRAAW